MKKILISVLLLTLFLTACSQQTINWDISHDNMPEEVEAFHREQLETYLALLEEDPYNKDYLFEVAYRYGKLGDGKKSEEYYLKVLEITPNDQTTLNNLANLYEEVGDYEQASIVISDLFNLNQTSVEVVRDTVRILLKAGKDIQAQDALEIFAREIGDNANTEEMTQFISDTFQSILDYREANGIETKFIKQ